VGERISHNLTVIGKLMCEFASGKVKLDPFHLRHNRRIRKHFLAEGDELSPLVHAATLTQQIVIMGRKPIVICLKTIVGQSVEITLQEMEDRGRRGTQVTFEVLLDLPGNAP
jgi:hypothetical protein